MEVKPITHASALTTTRPFNLKALKSIIQLHYLPRYRTLSNLRTAPHSQTRIDTTGLGQGQRYYLG